MNQLALRLLQSQHTVLQDELQTVTSCVSKLDSVELRVDDIEEELKEGRSKLVELKAACEGLVMQVGKVVIFN